jgi:hypothetical protein
MDFLKGAQRGAERVITGAITVRGLLLFALLCMAQPTVCRYASPKAMDLLEASLPTFTVGFNRHEKGMDTRLDVVLEPPKMLEMGACLKELVAQARRQLNSGEASMSNLAITVWMFSVWNDETQG